KAGNRTEKKEDGKKTTYTYNAVNQLVRETTENGTTTYTYDANGNLLKTSGSGVQAVYTYDHYNRLVSYTRGDITESYTYDAEGVRRSKTTGDTTVIFISDTTGELSHTLAETDGEGKATAVYTRGDTLISQTREDVTSTYLYDGHGDVRGLLNANGRFSDTYRYNAYGELLASKGDTENHYLYTGEYYDGTSGLYYLRARYMNPSTGTFISMDTYEGSIYDPDTLHKYLYANGNPVKYSDPSGNMFSIAGQFMATTISTVMNNFRTLNVMGVVSGVTNAAITGFLGGSDQDITMSFFTGYVAGFGMGAVLYIAAACSAVAYAQMLLIISASNVVMSTVMTIASVMQKNDKATLVYGTLTILSLFTLAQAYNLNCTVNVMGDKGSARIGWAYDNPEEVKVDDSRKADLGKKLDYQFGKAGGNKHNIDRTKGLKGNMEELGFDDTPENRAYFEQYYNDVLNDMSNQIGSPESASYTEDGITFYYTVTKRESFLMGKYGGAKVTTYWDGDRLLTIKISMGKGTRFNH
ncbi:MAG: hypothetical protein K2I10_06140, partial [Lachnospiraceae bacterium]|nr:hypothetical protein [Lachnospiraceae bacterium]